MKIRFLYTQDCSSHEEALRRLKDALKQEDVAADIEIVRVDTFEEAEREHYLGSPTILIDGRDISPTQDSHYAPACRAYGLEDGRVSPLPSMSMILKAIHSAKENLKSNR
jgi:hypothetical protein